MRGILKKCHKKCPYGSLAKTKADELGVIKGVPLEWGLNVGISQGVSLFVYLLRGSKKVGISQGMSSLVCQLKGGKKIGISQGMSLTVCQLKGSKKSRDIPRCVTICVPTEE